MNFSMPLSTTSNQVPRSPRRTSFDTPAANDERDLAELDAAQHLTGESQLIDRLDNLVQWMNKIDHTVAELLQQRTVKEWYSTEEVAKLLGRNKFTVREWCRLGRVHAQKRVCGRGRAQEWKISLEEVERIRNEGLLLIGHF